jgi:hypothetical protein
VTDFPSDATVDTYIALLAKAFDRHGIAGRWPWLVTNVEQLRSYAYALCDIPIALVAEALDVLVGEDNQPSPIRIRRVVAERCGVLGKRWDEAFTEALRLARWEDRYHNGERGEPRPDIDPEISSVLGVLGGARELLGEQRATIRAHFRDIWQARQTPADHRVVTGRGEITRRATAAGLCPPAEVRQLPRAAR